MCLNPRDLTVFSYFGTGMSLDRSSVWSELHELVKMHTLSSDRHINEVFINIFKERIVILMAGAGNGGVRVKIMFFGFSVS